MRNLRASIGAAIVGVGLLAAACGSSTGHVSTNNSGGGSGTQTTPNQPTTSTTASHGSGWG